MKERKVKIKLPCGIHALPVARIVKEAEKYQSDISIIKEGVPANAKSIMSILVLAIAYNEEIIIRAEGEDESEAVERIAKLIENLTDEF